MRFKGTACAVAVLAALLFAGPLSAQELTSGTIAGRVVDPSGHPVAGAAIIATCDFGTRAGETDDNGQFLLPFLRPGTYMMMPTTRATGCVPSPAPAEAIGGRTGLVIEASVRAPASPTRVRASSATTAIRNRRRPGGNS